MWLTPVFVITYINVAKLVAVVYTHSYWHIEIQGLSDINVLLLLHFFVAFAKLQTAIISFVIYVCLSVRLEQLGFHWIDFHEVWYLNFFFSKLCGANQSLIEVLQE
jgi:hypothetical protein